MSRPWKVLGIAAGLLVPALVGSAALAQAYPPGQPTASCSPTVVAAGGSITCSGGNWKPGTTVTIVLQPGAIVLGQTTVASDGTFSDTVTIPADTRPGKHVLQLRGLSMKNGTPFVVVVLITVTPAGAPSHDLAFTGANISAGVLILIVLMAMGIGALAVTRRRSRSRGINR